MDKCIFCNSQTSFIFEGEGKYKGKSICPKCQSEKLGTKFHTGCAGDDDYSLKLNRKDNN